MRHITYANVTATVGLFLGIGIGTAWAVEQNSIGAAQIKPNAVRTSELAQNAVTSDEVADGTLTRADLQNGLVTQGVHGADGAQGPIGPQGPVGPQGPPGADGTQLSDQHLLDKLKNVDGAGSGLDADQIDGIDSQSLAHGYTFHHAFFGNDLPGGTIRFVSLGLRVVRFSCHNHPDDPLDPARLEVRYDEEPGQATLNAMSHTQGVEYGDVTIDGYHNLRNGPERIGTNVDDAAGFILEDPGSGAGSELQLIIQQDGAVYTVSLHLFVFNDANEQSFCEVSGSVMLPSS
jgi:hypothetical protein